MDLFFYYLLFCTLCLFAMFMVRRKVPGRIEVELSPEFVLVASFFLYTSSLPISRFLMGSAREGQDVGYMQASILGALGLLLGLAASRTFLRAPKPLKTFAPMPARRCLGLVVTAFFIVSAYWYYILGFSLANFLKPYGFEQTLSTDYSLVDTLLIPGTLALILSCCWSAFTVRRQRPLLFWQVLSMTALVSMVFLVRGSRNPVIILGLPICAMLFQGRRIPLVRMSLATLGIFVLFSVIALVRNFGLADRDRASVNTGILDPLRGELGTAYHVYSLFTSFPDLVASQYGKTYTIELIENLVPRRLWPNRPPASAIRFSVLITGATSEHDLTTGLGYSPVVEAMTDFGPWGIPFAFAAFAFIVAAGRRYYQNRGRWGQLSFFIMLPMLINWNRIDSSTATKMFFVYVGFFWMFERVLYVRAPSTPQPRPVFIAANPVPR